MVEDSVSDLEKNISEIRIQMASGGSGIIVPEAFVRQQNQEKDDNGKWIAKNYNIYVYPLYDCNLYELQENQLDQFTEEIIGNIIDQCFIRKSFYKSYLPHSTDQVLKMSHLSNHFGSPESPEPEKKLSKVLKHLTATIKHIMISNLKIFWLNSKMAQMI